MVAHTSWQKHELLHGQFVSGVAASVDHVESWNGQHQLFVAGQVSNVTVQWHTLFTTISSHF